MFPAKSTLLFIAALTVFAPPSEVRAGDGEGLTFGGLLDLRAARTDDTPSWLDGGLGKVRYAPPVAGRATVLRLSQASLFVDAPAGEFVSAHLQVNAEADGDREAQRSRVDLIEAFVSLRAEPSARVRLRGRLGLFFPPVSLEADGPAWTGPYTITPSAATSWVADELRTLGAEARVSLRPEQQEIALSAAAYGSNDPTGSLLAWRGWTMGDRQTGVSDRLPLARLPSIQADGVFPRQAPWVQPFREIDGRLGYYVAASWKKTGVFDLRTMHFDNRGRPTDFDGYQYAWHTTFDSAALRVQWRGLELLGQYLSGSTLMGGILQGRTAVDAPFQAAFGMASLTHGRHRLSARYDDFEVEDRDVYPNEDGNAEQGHAWTAAYALRTGESHRLAVEVLHVESDRGVRAAVGLPVRATETLAQASFRVKF